jgi:uncharacterized protein
MNHTRCLIMFAKYPEKGKVKSRLSKQWDEDMVVHLYRLFIEDLLERLSDGNYCLRVACHPAERQKDFIDQFGQGFSCMAQIGEDLGERMSTAFSRCFSEGHQEVVVIGSDSPDLPIQIVQEAFDAVEKNGTVIGPSFDGGYYLIGFRKESFYPGVFEGISWGTDTVFEETMLRLKNAKIPVHVLPPWRDIDRAEDIEALITNNEQTDFATSKTMSFLARHPRFSIIIPVLDEEAIIAATIEHLRNLQGAAGPCEIIVIDGDPEAQTIRAIRDKRVITGVGSKGRGSQMNRGAALAKGDILVFLHADTRLPLNALRLISSVLSDPPCMAGAFDLAIDSDRFVFRLIEKTASIRSRITRIPYGDQALFFRRHYFDAIEGFVDIPIMEDVEIMRRIKKRGDRIGFVSQPVITSARRWEREGAVRRTVRNWLLICLYSLGVSPDRLTRWYR